ncbi:hypothetical protein Hanom_Chr15g01385951 [Helianthus anomalus]
MDRIELCVTCYNNTPALAYLLSNYLFIVNKFHKPLEQVPCRGNALNYVVGVDFKRSSNLTPTENLLIVYQQILNIHKMNSVIEKRFRYVL